MNHASLATQRLDRGVAAYRNSSPIALLVLAGMFVAAIPFDELVRLNIPLLRNPAAILGVAYLATFILMRRGRFHLYSATQVLAIAFISIVGVQELLRLTLADIPNTTYTGTPSISEVGPLYMARLQPIVLFLLISNTARDQRSVGFALFSLPIVMSTLGLGVLFVSDVGRWAPVGLNENFAGGAFGMSIVIAIAALLNRRSQSTWSVALLLSACIPFCVIGLLVSGSRTASAATLVALCVLFVLSQVRLRRLLVVGTGFLALTLATAPYFLGASEVLVSRWGQTLDGTSYGSRDTLIQISVDLVADRPAWGHGLQGNYAIGSRWWGEPGRPFSAHNTFLALLVMFGVAGALPWFGMFALGAHHAWQHRHHANGALLLSLLTLVAVHMLAGDLSTNKLLYVILGLAVGLRHATANPSTDDDVQVDWSGKHQRS